MLGNIVSMLKPFSSSYPHFRISRCDGSSMFAQEWSWALEYYFKVWSSLPLRSSALGEYHEHEDFTDWASSAALPARAFAAIDAFRSWKPVR